MDNEPTIGAQFVLRLLENPALASFSPLQKELHIINFLKVNINQLYPTLSSAGYFPGKTKDQIFSMVYESLKQIINKSLFPHLKKIITENIDFSFISSLTGSNGLKNAMSEQVLGFLQKLLQKSTARLNFLGPLTALDLAISDKYIDESFQRRSYLHFELTKVQKLSLTQEETKNLIKLSLLLKTSVNLLAVGGDVNSQEVRAAAVQNQFADKVLGALESQLDLIPPEALKSALHSNISFLESPDVEATARVAAIFAARCSNFRQFTKIDRGADTPDKSWFNIARRNYKFYGFDSKMLDEFYKTAAENGW
ncbi:MAG: hypothetical protein JW822_01650 [Spirochaetales bacterium]|nr:hypothetical protein [Spirochaetales bacterium]